MPTVFIPYLALTSTKLTTYFGSIILVAGVLGDLLNVLVFLSLRTFRQNSSAFYLLVASVVNIGQLLTGLLSRIMISAFSVDWTSKSAAYCKLRAYLIQVFTLISLTTVCFATIDQFFATSNSVRMRSWCNVKVANRLSALCIIFWILYFIPYLTFYDRMYLPNTETWVCTITNQMFLAYANNFCVLVLFGPLPLLITVIFALLAYSNLQQISYRTVPLVRLELDK